MLFKIKMKLVVYLAIYFAGHICSTTIVNINMYFIISFIYLLVLKYALEKIVLQMPNLLLRFITRLELSLCMTV